MSERPQRRESPRELAHRIAKGFRQVIENKEKHKEAGAAQGFLEKISNWRENSRTQKKINEQRGRLNAELTANKKEKWRTIGEVAEEDNARRDEAQKALAEYAAKFGANVGSAGFTSDPGSTKFNSEPDRDNLQRSILEAIAMDEWADDQNGPDTLKPRAGYTSAEAARLSREAGCPFTLIVEDLYDVAKGVGGMQGQAKGYFFPLTPEIVRVVTGRDVDQIDKELLSPYVSERLGRENKSTYRLSLFRYR